MGLNEKASEKGLEAVTDLVKNKAPNVLGMLFPYFGLEKKALDTYEEEIKKSDLSPKTKAKLLLTAKSDIKKWKNQESIADIAFNEAKEGTDFSEKSGVNEEWFERFMDSAKFVSSEDMQLIWGKILAGEFEKPGSTPPNMIRVLSEMTPELAQAFQKICSMKVTIAPIKENGQVENESWEEAIIVPFNGNEKNFSKSGLSFEVLNELDSLGVIKFEPVAVYATDDFKNGMYNICIYNDNYKVKNNNDSFRLGDVMLTNVGKALQKITEPLEITDYCGMVQQYFLRNGVAFHLKKGQEITLGRV